MSDPGTTSDGRRLVRAAWAGTAVAVLVLLASLTLPHLLSWDVVSRYPEPGKQLVPPLHGWVEVKLLGPGTVPAVLLAVVGWLYLPRWAEVARWRTLLAVAFVVGLAWLLALALVDGTDGISRVQAFPTEYLRSALGVTDVGAMLDGFVARIPYGVEQSWDTHVAGHPPAALLFFVALVRLGIDTPFGVGLAVTVVAAAATPGVLVALRALDAEPLARRVMPYLVLTPAAVFMAVSADAVFATVTAWGLALLALATRATTRRSLAAWSLGAGVVLGLSVFLSYGLPLMGAVAVGVLAAARTWRPLPWAVAAAVLVVLAFGLLGFWWWEGYGPLHDRYFAGIASERPQAYWVFGDLGALLLSAGPLLGAGLACALLRARDGVRGAVGEVRTAALLGLSAAAALLAADLSRMSKAEVERIWLPFIPWALVSLALLPERWRRPALGVQLATALLVQHLLWTHW